MTTVKVTQLATEVLVQASANARVTQLATEVLWQASPNVKITQLAVEVLIPVAAPATAFARGYVIG